MVGKHDHCSSKETCCCTTMHTMSHVIQHISLIISILGWQPLHQKLTTIYMYWRYHDPAAFILKQPDRQHIVVIWVKNCQLN